MLSSIPLLISVAAALQSDPTPLWDGIRLEREGQVVESQLIYGGGGRGGGGGVRVPDGWVGEGWEILGAASWGDRLPRRVAALLRRNDSLRVVGGSPGQNADIPEWTVELPPQEPLDSEGAFLLEPQPGSIQSRARFSPIVPLGDSFLVLPSERGDLVLIDPKDGTIRYRLDAPWEIERGFTGPSMSSPTLRRFGDAGLDGSARDDPALVDAGRPAFERRRTGWVVDRVRVGEERIFVALAHATPGPWFRQRASGSILELDERLRPLTLTELPEPVMPGLAIALEDGVVWPLATSGFARTDTTPDNAAHGAGPGGHDRRGALRWITRPSEPGEAAFWRMDRVGDPIEFSMDSVFRLPSGSWISRERRNELRLPFDRIELDSGRLTRFEVVVPLDRDVGAPETDYGLDGTTYDSLGGRIASLTRLFRGPQVGLILFFGEAAGGKVLVIPDSSLAAR